MLRVFRHYLSAPALALLCLEAAVLFGVIYLLAQQLTLAVGDGETVHASAIIVPVCLFVSAVLCAIGMYDQHALANYRRAALRLVVAFVICWPALFVPALMLIQVTPLTAALGSGAVMVAAFASVFVARLAWGRAAELLNLRRRVLVLGVGPKAARIEAALRGRDSGPLVVGYVRFPNEAAAIDSRRIISPENTLWEAARRLRVDEIVVAVDDRRGVPLEPLLECRANGITVTEQLNFWERETRKVMLEALSPGWLIYSDGFQLGSFVNRGLKRQLDILVSVAVLVFTLPLTLLAAAAIKLDSPGPLFYRQERVGLHGRVFTALKFRSMRVDAERDGVPRWAAERDPRITRVGHFLRMTRIDEVPQVWNVLKGDMSFIGPRPERPFFVDALSRQIPFYSERARVRPGITGWAQINYPYGASIADAREKLAYDLYYIKNYSLLLDILVLIGTVEAVLWPKGAR